MHELSQGVKLQKEVENQGKGYLGVEAPQDCQCGVPKKGENAKKKTKDPEQRWEAGKGGKPGPKESCGQRSEESL